MIVGRRVSDERVAAAIAQEPYLELELFLREALQIARDVKERERSIALALDAERRRLVLT